MILGEVEGLAMLDLPTIPLAEPTSYILFPHKGRGVLWLRMKRNVAHTSMKSIRMKKKAYNFPIVA